MDRTQLVALTPEEQELIEDYRSLTKECRGCMKILMQSAVQASAIDGTVIDLMAHYVECKA